MGKASSDDFWRFSLRLYRRPGIEEACLWLQDRSGADVNLLLLCCWMGSRGREAGTALLRRAAVDVAAWRRGVLEPLRRVRRRIKARVPGVPAAWGAPVRAGVKSVELLAEKVEQRLLARRAGGPGGPRGDPAANLARYRALLGASPGPGVARRLALLAAAAGVPGHH